MDIGGSRHDGWRERLSTAANISVERAEAAFDRLCSAFRPAREAIEQFSRHVDSWCENMRVWLDRQWADAMRRRELPPPALAVRAGGSAWPVSVKAWRFQEARMRKGLRQS